MYQDAGEVERRSADYIDDLRIAARMLVGRKAAEGTRLVVYPASRSVLLQAISEGLVATLVEAGAAVCAPGCGFCIGRTVALGEGEAVLSTQNRNFKGRMGNNSVEIYRSSVETAAVSTIKVLMIGDKYVVPEG